MNHNSDETEILPVSSLYYLPVYGGTGGGIEVNSAGVVQVGVYGWSVDY